MDFPLHSSKGIYSSQNLLKVWAIEQCTKGNGERVRSRISDFAPHTSEYDSSFSQDPRWFLYTVESSRSTDLQNHTCLNSYYCLISSPTPTPQLSSSHTRKAHTNLLDFLKHAGMLLDYGFLSGCSLCLKWSPPGVAIINSPSHPLSLCWNIIFLGTYLEYSKNVNCPSPENFHPSLITY